MHKYTSTGSMKELVQLGRWDGPDETHGSTNGCVSQNEEQSVGAMYTCMHRAFEGNRGGRISVHQCISIKHFSFPGPKSKPSLYITESPSHFGELTCY